MGPQMGKGMAGATSSPGLELHRRMDLGGANPSLPQIQDRESQARGIPLEGRVFREKPAPRS